MCMDRVAAPAEQADASGLEAQIPRVSLRNRNVTVAAVAASPGLST